MPKMSKFDASPSNMGIFRWKILDVVEKQFYALRNPSITDPSINGMNTVFKCWTEWRNYTMAANGNLINAVCVSVQTGDQRHIICNPVAKKLHHIAAPKIHLSFNRDIVVMSVDKATQTYRTILMETCIKHGLRRQGSCLYDSTTMKWKKLCDVPRGCGDRAMSYIFWRKVFYVLFLNLSRAPRCPYLYTCDLETDEWSHINAALPQASHSQEKAQLVVSLGRLFLVEYTRLPSLPLTSWDRLLIRSYMVKRKQLIRVAIREILLAGEWNSKVKKVVEMPKYSKYPRGMLTPLGTVVGDPVVALGCGSFIVVSSVLGRNVAWDLLRNCWHELPASTPCHRGIFAGLVDM